MKISEEPIIQNWGQLCACSRQFDVQDIWGQSGLSLRSQTRRRGVSAELLGRCRSQLHIDIGCAEGFMTSAFDKIVPTVIAFDVQLFYLKKARTAVPKADFCLASITHLPIPDNMADSVSVLEVLEHLPMNIVEAGIVEIDRVLKTGGSLLVSVPNRERITFDICETCGKLRPDNPSWHLHSFDEARLRNLLPSDYSLEAIVRCVNLPQITCSRVLSNIPTSLWLTVNNLAGFVVESPHLLVKFEKRRGPRARASPRR